MRTRVEFREPTERELELMLEQAREIANLREEHLRRDGMIYDSLLKAVMLKEADDEQ